MAALSGCAVGVTPVDEGNDDPAPIEVPPASVAGIVNDLTTGEGVGDVDVCALVDGEAVCAHSGDAGAYEIRASLDGSPVDLTFLKSGYPTTRVRRAASTGNLWYPADLVSTDDVARFAEAAGASFSETDAQILVRTTFVGFEPLPLEDVTLHAEGVEFVYADGEDRADASLDAASAAGWAMAFEIAPGSVDLSATHPADVRCGVVDDGADVGGTTRVEVEPGELTLVDVVCKPNEELMRELLGG